MYWHYLCVGLSQNISSVNNSQSLNNILNQFHLPVPTSNHIHCLWRHILILSSFLKALNFLDVLTPNFYIRFLRPLSDLHLICNCSYCSSTRWCVFIMKFLIKQHPTLQSDSFPPFQVKIFLAVSWGVCTYRISTTASRICITNNYTIWLITITNWNDLEKIIEWGYNSLYKVHTSFVLVFISVAVSWHYSSK